MIWLFFFYQNVSLLILKEKEDVRRSNKYLRFDNVGVYTIFGIVWWNFTLNDTTAFYQNTFFRGYFSLLILEKERKKQVLSNVKWPLLRIWNCLIKFHINDCFLQKWSLFKNDVSWVLSREGERNDWFLRMWNHLIKYSYEWFFENALFHIVLQEGEKESIF